jgi:hypothetical protein
MQQQQQSKGGPRQQVQQGGGKRKAVAAAAVTAAGGTVASGGDAAKRRKSAPVWTTERLDALVSSREQGFRNDAGVSSRGSWSHGIETAGTTQLLAGFARAVMTNKWNALVAKAGATAEGRSSRVAAYGGGGQVELTAQLLARIRQQAGVEQQSGQ